MTCIQLVLTHYPLALILGAAAATFFFLPLQLQALEPYAYAAGIEKYYDFSTLFSLASGTSLPDFGRYHPNHPLGHALAGVIYDWLGIPALSWMKGINGISGLVSGFFLYVIILETQISKKIATLTVALYMSTHFAWLAIFSGEWHMPALALSLAGIWRAMIYIRWGNSHHLYQAAVLIGLAACYHMNSFFFTIPLGSILLFIRPWRERWREILIAGMILGALLLTCYVIIPCILFGFSSPDDFFRTFFIYKGLRPTPYAGFEWLQIALRTLFHGFAFLYAGMPYIDIFAFAFVISFLSLLVKFCISDVMRPMKIMLVVMTVFWLTGHWLFGVRPDALNGWLFAAPFLCLIIVKAMIDFHPRIIIIAAALPVALCGWNLKHWLLPNAMKKPNEVFLFQLPVTEPVTTPVGFIVHQPPFSFAEIWHAGSQLGYKNQKTFFPCCGERGFQDRLISWLRMHKRALLVSDGNFAQIEELMKSQGLRYERLLDQIANWPASMTPATVYLPLKAPLQLRKRIVIWRPMPG
jgi:hypothetical protein